MMEDGYPQAAAPLPQNRVVENISNRVSGAGGLLYLLESIDWL